MNTNHTNQELIRMLDNQLKELDTMRDAIRNKNFHSSIIDYFSEFYNKACYAIEIERNYYYENDKNI